MTNDAATLYCPNCQAENPLSNKFCQQCSTPLPQRYLWVVGGVSGVGSPGELLADRYLIINPNVVLDTVPGLTPQVPELEKNQFIRPYLRLIPYRLNVPQVYGIINILTGEGSGEILLLEKPPLLVDTTEPNQPKASLAHQLTDAWHNATSMRQLNWLWQIVQLWQPLKSEGVVSSLLDSHLLRVEGSLIRLLELRPDPNTAPELAQLGQFWQQLANDAQPAIADFLQQISGALIAGQINSAEVLISLLDQGLRDLAQTQTPTIQIITKTDTGPRRERNEDACYPQSGKLLSTPPDKALAIVCDGIGGHEGGNVASNLAIETIQQQVQQLTRLPAAHVDPALVLEDLEKAVAIANDKISQRNDSENRQGRKRMGTTLVMALPIAHEIYITHVGDSRAYWITRQGCYQVTLDDDVASREVRLGYALYREAVQQSGAGSLVQALGMSPSSSLHPTAQRFICDEDTVFLLTSDGLSDFDRVEEYWEKEILPIVNTGKNLVNVADRLIEIANTKNGHDNVTIALVHYQIKYTEPAAPISVIIPANTPVAPTPPRVIPATLLEAPVPAQPTKVLRKSPTNIRNLPWQIFVPLVLAIAVGSVTYLITSRLKFGNTSVTSSPTAPLEPSTAIPKPEPERTVDNLAPKWIIKTKKQIPLANQTSLAPETFLVVDKKLNSDNSDNYEVSLRVCSQKPLPKPLKFLESAVSFKYSQLKSWEAEDKIEVWLPSDETPCDSNAPETEPEKNQSSAPSTPGRSDPTTTNNQ